MFKIKSYLKGLTLCFAVVLLCSCNQKPDFVYLSGEPGDLSDLKGQWIIINFWAEWCSPCREEVRILSEIATKNQIPNTSIIGVSYDPLDVADLKRVVHEWQFGYPVISTQPIPILPFSLPKKLPALYILSPNLELVAKISGEQDFESINKLLNSLQSKNN
jgi:thiol-disulfide isomerase/thioredoxin